MASDSASSVDGTDSNEQPHFRDASGVVPCFRRHSSGETHSAEDSIFLEEPFDMAMMFRFKVAECPKEAAHNWNFCPYAHEGEHARRRDPRIVNYGGTKCREKRRGRVCALGENCPYSHNVFESWLHPRRYRTQMCEFGKACKRTVCFFAHKPEELREPDDLGMEEPGKVQEAAAAGQGSSQSLSSRRSSFDAPFHHLGSSTCCNSPQHVGRNSHAAMQARALLAQASSLAQMESAYNIQTSPTRALVAYEREGQLAAQLNAMALVNNLRAQTLYGQAQNACNQDSQATAASQAGTLYAALRASIGQTRAPIAQYGAASSQGTTAGGGLPLWQSPPPSPPAATSPSVGTTSSPLPYSLLSIAGHQTQNAMHPYSIIGTEGMISGYNRESFYSTDKQQQQHRTLQPTVTESLPFQSVNSLEGLYGRNQADMVQNSLPRGAVGATDPLLWAMQKLSIAQDAPVLPDQYFPELHRQTSWDPSGFLNTSSALSLDMSSRNSLDVRDELLTSGSDTLSLPNTLLQPEGCRPQPQNCNLQSLYVRAVENALLGAPGQQQGSPYLPGYLTH